MARVMYFESNRSSDAGMLAVGTVVMNRLNSGKHGSTVCQVVGQPNQFAPGVLSRPMTDSGRPRAFRMADTVLAGARHPAAKDSLFFHTYGYRFPYNNMKYTLVAGGNAFYEKRQPPKTFFGGEGRWPGPPTPSERVMIAHAEPYNDRSLSHTSRDVVAAASRPAPAINERPEIVEERVARRGVPREEPFDIASNGVDQRIPADGVDDVPQYEPLSAAGQAETRPTRRAPSRYELLAQADLPRPAPVRQAAAVPQYEPGPAPRSAPARYERLAQADLPRPAPMRQAAAIPQYEPVPAPVRAAPQYEQAAAQRNAPSRYERLAQAEPSFEPRPAAPRSIETRPLPAPARVATREMEDYDAPRAPAPSRRRETAGSPTELGWQVGPQPALIDDVPAEYVPSVPARGARADNYDEPTGAASNALRGKDRIVRGY